MSWLVPSLPDAVRRTQASWNAWTVAAGAYKVAASAMLEQAAVRILAILVVSLPRVSRYVAICCINRQ